MLPLSTLTVTNNINSSSLLMEIGGQIMIIQQVQMNVSIICSRTVILTRTKNCFKFKFIDGNVNNITYSFPVGPSGLEYKEYASKYFKRDLSYILYDLKLSNFTSFVCSFILPTYRRLLNVSLYKGFCLYPYIKLVCIFFFIERNLYL